MTTAEQLFKDYDQYRLHTTNYRAMLKAKRFLRSPKCTTERLVKLKKLIEFCEGNDLEPRLYLYSLFVARRWNFSPHWHQLVPGSKAVKRKAIARYHGLTDVQIYGERLRQEYEAKTGPLYDPNRDLSNHTENVKRKYLAVHDTDRCLAEMRSATFGFHPQSVVCSGCPVALRCQQILQASLPFDIQALRRGELTLDQAQRIAGRAHAPR